MEPIIIGIGFLCVLIIAYLLIHTEKQVNQVKFNYIEKNQQESIKEWKQEKREFKKELQIVKEEVIDNRTDNRVNQEATKAKFYSVDENFDRLFLKQRKANTKFNQHKVEFQSIENKNSERFYQQDKKLEVTQATNKTAIEFINKNINELDGELKSTNQKINQHEINYYDSQKQNEQRFNQQETQRQVQQAETRTAIKYIDQGIDKLQTDIQRTTQNIYQHTIDSKDTQMKNEQRFNQQETQHQVQQAETRTAIKYIDLAINKLQTDVQDTNQRANQQQIEFNNARFQITEQFSRVGIENEKIKQATHSAIQIIDSKISKMHQEQKSGTNQLLNVIGSLNPLVNVAVQAVKVISEVSKNNNSGFDEPTVFDSTSEPMPKFEFQNPSEVVDQSPVLSSPEPHSNDNSQVDIQNQ